MSVHGSAVRSMAVRSSPGRGFSTVRVSGVAAGLGAGAVVCWANEVEVRAKQASAPDVIRERRDVERFGEMLTDNLLMQGSPFVEDLGALNQ